MKCQIEKDYTGLVVLSIIELFCFSIRNPFLFSDIDYRDIKSYSLYGIKSTFIIEIKVIKDILVYREFNINV